MEPNASITVNPWENRQQLGTFAALIQTVKQSLLSPMEFFADTPASGGLESPMWYGVIMLSIGTALGQIWGLLWNVVVTALGAAGAASSGHVGPEILLQGGLGIGFNLVFIVLSPLFAFIGVFTKSGIVHLALLILGGNHRGFEATFRSVCYAQGPMILSVIPIIGPAVGSLWAFVLEIMALMRLQQIEGWRATTAVLLFPCSCVLLVLAAVLLIFVLIGAGMLGAGSGLGSMLHNLP